MPTLSDGRTIRSIIQVDLVQKGYEQISAATLAAATPLTVPNGTVETTIQCTGGTVRWRCDGTDPTSIVGAIIADGGSVTLRGPAAAGAFKAIMGSGAPVLDVTFWG